LENETNKVETMKLIFGDRNTPTIPKMYKKLLNC